MEEFNRAVKKVLHHEGGYVNDPSDPGGETKYGISKRAYPDLDIKGLTEQDAIDIYYKDYWIRGKCEILPKSIREVYFDMVVNMGKKRAVLVLQEAINHKIKNNISVDGQLGPKTASASKNLEEYRLKSFRVKYYADLVNRKPTLLKYWFGWFKRALT
tara:strand:- start:469 stop:942 length:474 start_codon:yes stop_codon:yes gene_type:complete